MSLYAVPRYTDWRAAAIIDGPAAGRMVSIAHGEVAIWRDGHFYVRSAPRGAPQPLAHVAFYCCGGDDATL